MSKLRSRLLRTARPITVISVAWICAAQVENKAGDDPAFRTSVQPFLTKNCVGCHSSKIASAGMNLEQMANPAASNTHPEIWVRVFTRLSKNEMPPPGIPRPPQTDVNAVTGWIAANFKTALAEASKPTPVAVGDAGHVTMRRLNRVEYNNTIRDLMGLKVDATAAFPIDDSGYGFDNNGDVLSLSPMLMEKYISTATNLSKLAVYGPEKPKPDLPLVRFRAANQPTSGSLPVSLTITFLPYSLRGVLEGSYDFPQDADYEFSFRSQDGRGVQSNPPLPAEGGPTGPMTTNAYVLKYGNGVVNRALAEAAKVAAEKGLPPPPRVRRVYTPEEQQTRREQMLKVFPPAAWVFELDGKVVAQGVPRAGGALVTNAFPPAEKPRLRLSAGVHTFRIYYPEALKYENAVENYNPDNRGRGLAVGNLDITGPFNGGPEPLLESRKKIFVCAEQTTACATRIMETFASRAYRRPATAQESRLLLSLFNLNHEHGNTFDEGIRVAVQTVLQSPAFLFRVEAAPKTGAAAAASKAAPAVKTVRAYQISDYELASRLSYFLWSSMPDDELFDLAKQQKLRQPGVLKAQMQRMLTDPKVDELVKNFGGQWLGIRELARRRPDPDLFRIVDDFLPMYMQKETYLFLTAMLRENRNILELIDAPFTFVNGPLAKFYGIPNVQGLDFQRIILQTDQRGGILSHGSVLMASAMPTRTSVVTRGKWVLENILGTPPPPPPPDVPALDEKDLGKAVTLRQRMEQHRADPVCATCHNKLDPIGFSLENYDSAGAWRVKDGDLPIDNTGTLPDGRSFQGVSGLRGLLKDHSDEIVKSITEKMLTFALGRGLEAYDAPVVDAIAKRVKAEGYRMQTLVGAVIESKPFQMKDGVNE